MNWWLALFEIKDYVRLICIAKLEDPKNCHDTRNGQKYIFSKQDEGKCVCLVYGDKAGRM